MTLQRLALSACFLLPACGDDGQTGPGDCTTPRAMGTVARAISQDVCRARLDALWGRVAMVNQASGTVWTRRTPHRTGIVVTAAHVAPLCGPPVCPSRVWDPEAKPGLASVRLAEESGPSGGDVNAMFPLFNTETPAGELGDNIAQIRPSHDFSLVVVDQQHWVLADLQLAPRVEPVVKAPLPLHDPDGLTLAAVNHRDPAAGEAVLLLGYPAAGETAGQLTYSVAIVLTDDEATAELARLAGLGDEEGALPYDASAEFLVRGPQGIAAAGMSGGGVFDQDGLFLGVLVRGSTASSGAQIVRVVRLAYILDRLDATLATLGAAARTEVAEFLPEP